MTNMNDLTTEQLLKLKPGEDVFFSDFTGNGRYSRVADVFGDSGMMIVELEAGRIFTCFVN